MNINNNEKKYKGETRSNNGEKECTTGKSSPALTLRIRSVILSENCIDCVLGPSYVDHLTGYVCYYGKMKISNKAG